MASSLASVVTTDRLPESKVRRTGAVVRHAFSLSKLCCSVGPQDQGACGPHRLVSGAAMSA